MKISYQTLYFFKYGLEFNLITKDWIKNWADRLIMDDKVGDNFYIFDICTARFDNEILTLINYEIERFVENVDLKEVGKSLIGLIYKNLKNGLINIDGASSKNYAIQLHFLQETDFDLGGYNLDDVYQLARQNIVGDYEKEKQNLINYLIVCERKLDDFLLKHDLKLETKAGNKS